MARSVIAHHGCTGFIDGVATLKASTEAKNTYNGGTSCSKKGRTSTFCAKCMAHSLSCKSEGDMKLCPGLTESSSPIGTGRGRYLRSPSSSLLAFASPKQSRVANIARTMGQRYIYHDMMSYNTTTDSALSQSIEDGVTTVSRSPLSARNPRGHSGGAIVEITSIVQLQYRAPTLETNASGPSPIARSRLRRDGRRPGTYVILTIPGPDFST